MGPAVVQQHCWVNWVDMESKKATCRSCRVQFHQGSCDLCCYLQHHHACEDGQHPVLQDLGPVGGRRVLFRRGLSRHATLRGTQ